MSTRTISRLALDGCSTSVSIGRLPHGWVSRACSLRVDSGFISRISYRKSWLNVRSLRRASRVSPAVRTVPRAALTRFILVTDTIRSLIDRGAITFYRSEADRPGSFPNERMLTDGYLPEPRSVQDFVARKVWLLGLKAGSGRKETRVWIADPWDAAYLGCTEAELREAANVLDAQDKIVREEDGEFAQVGRALLASEGALAAAARKKSSRLFSTIFDVYTPQGSIGEGGSGRVVRVTDEAGTPHALKYLKPQVMTTEKAKRFRNELVFFFFRNAHRNIIDSGKGGGLAENCKGRRGPVLCHARISKDSPFCDEEQQEPRGASSFLHSSARRHGSPPNRDLAAVGGLRYTREKYACSEDTDKRAAITDFGVAHFSELVLSVIRQRSSGEMPFCEFSLRSSGTEVEWTRRPSSRYLRARDDSL